jgi:hypothetical protein
MRKEQDGRGEPRPFSFMAKAKRGKCSERMELVIPEAGSTAAAMETTEAEEHNKLVSAGEARKKAQQRVFRAAEELVGNLIENRGNYLAIKFLFEFAGLSGDALDDAEEDSPLLKAYLQQLQKGTGEAKAEANNGA